MSAQRAHISSREGLQTRAPVYTRDPTSDALTPRLVLVLTRLRSFDGRCVFVFVFVFIDAVSCMCIRLDDWLDLTRLSLFGDRGIIIIDAEAGVDGTVFVDWRERTRIMLSRCSLRASEGVSSGPGTDRGEDAALRSRSFDF